MVVAVAAVGSTEPVRELCVEVLYCVVAIVALPRSASANAAAEDWYTVDEGSVVSDNVL